MKISVYSMLLVWAFFACQRQQEVCEDVPVAVPENNGFDQELANALGADEYGMSPYVMAILKSGPNPAPNEAVRDSLFRGHMDNIQRMAEEGMLVMAGPFLSDPEWRGIYIFDVKTVEEARALTETDPAIQYGSLVMELKPWYGSAALKELNQRHKKIAKKEV